MSAFLDLQQDLTDAILQDFASSGANVLKTDLLPLFRQRPKLRDYPARNGLGDREPGPVLFAQCEAAQERTGTLNEPGFGLADLP